MQERYRPNVTVAAVVHYKGRFLLVEERINQQIVFNQPAGHLEANESVEQACSRELYEETGIRAQADSLICIYQFQANNNASYLRFTFAIELDVLSPIRPQDPQIISAQWLTYDEIKQQQSTHRSPLVMQSIDDYLANKQHDLSILNHDFL